MLRFRVNVLPFLVRFIFDRELGSFVLRASFTDNQLTLRSQHLWDYLSLREIVYHGRNKLNSSVTAVKCKKSPSRQWGNEVIYLFIYLFAYLFVHLLMFLRIISCFTLLYSKETGGLIQ